MAKWEYLLCERDGSSDDGSCGIEVAKDKVRALAQHLKSALPAHGVKINKYGIIEMAFRGGGLRVVDVYDVLGELEWETVGAGVFKRPRGTYAV